MLTSTDWSLKMLYNFNRLFKAYNFNIGGLRTIAVSKSIT